MNVNSTSQNIMITQSTDNSASNRQFKSENIRFFNSELEIKKIAFILMTRYEYRMYLSLFKKLKIMSASQEKN